MSRIPSAFRRLAKLNEIALIPYVAAGIPSLEMTRRLLPVIGRQGADMIALGPTLFDPLAGAAEGPVAASESEVSIEDCLSVASEARRTNEVPLLFSSLYGPLRSYGPEAFAAHAAASGIDGLIVFDLPPEEEGSLHAACRAAGLDLIFVVDASCAEDRLRLVAEMAGGFIYCVWRESDPEITGLVERIRRYTDLPVVVGPGISEPEQVALVARYAGGVVAGSALMDSMEGLPEDEIMLAASDCIRSLKEATAKQ